MQNTRKPRILITYIESGKGHIMSMRSIEGALRQRYGDKVEIIVSNIMSDDGFKPLMNMEKFLVKQTENTNKFEIFGKFIFPFIGILGGQSLMRFVHRQICPKSYHAILEAFATREPDMIITNHYFTNMAAVDYFTKVDSDCVPVNYNPDNTMHSFWDKRGGIFVVNNDLAFKRARRLGFKRDNLRCVVPAVRKEVELCQLTKKQCRERLGLDDRFTVTLSDGAYMMGRAPKFAKCFFKIDKPINICLIAGENEEKYKYFTDIAEGRSKIKLPKNMNVKVYRFMPNAFELYRASDLFITKGGPNAVIDSIYMNTPVLINYCPHLIEEATSDLFVKHYKCGVRIQSATRARRFVEKCIDDPSILDDYRENIRNYIPAVNGADMIADILIDELVRRGKIDEQVAYSERYGYVDPIEPDAVDDLERIIDEQPAVTGIYNNYNKYTNYPRAKK